MIIRTITMTAISSGMCRRGTAGAGCGLMSATDAGQAIADQVLCEREDACHCRAGGWPSAAAGNDDLQRSLSAAGQIDINRDIA
jgi:hypothetical protein